MTSETYFYFDRDSVMMTYYPDEIFQYFLISEIHWEFRNKSITYSLKWRWTEIISTFLETSLAINRNQ